MAVDEARQQAERGVPGSMEGHAAMAVAGLTIELAFGAAGLVPRERAALVVEPRVTLTYTTGLNVLFVAIAAGLLVRFFRTNGLTMLRMMDRPPDEPHGHPRHDAA